MNKENNSIYNIEDIQFANLISKVAESIDYRGDSRDIPNRFVSELSSIKESVFGALKTKNVDTILDATISLETYLSDISTARGEFGFETEESICELIEKYDEQINKLDNNTELDEYIVIYKSLLNDISAFNVNLYESFMILLSRLDLLISRWVNGFSYFL